jgi:tetratricopeptide (TPR) repeat protein
MKKKDASFWSEIKTLDERLVREPDSFCFARLSEIYLKVGLVADALHTARHGVARHPGYLAGQRSLAMACNASDLRDECRAILEQFTAAMPEDVEAQKLLANLYVESGDTSSAAQTYATVLDFRPDDVQSRKQLETLQQGCVPETASSSAVVEHVLVEEAAVEEAAVEEAAVEEAAVEEVAVEEVAVEEVAVEEVAVEEVAVEEVAVEEVAVEEDEIIELSEDDIYYDDELEEELVVLPVAEITVPEHHDPLSTQTLAELYEQQGFIAKALDIYRTILADAPDNIRLLEKITQLEQQESHPTATAESVVRASESTSEVPPAEQTFSFTDTAEKPFLPAGFNDMSAPLASLDLAPLAHKEADNVVETLDGWLENIRRIKACR